LANNHFFRLIDVYIHVIAGGPVQKLGKV